MKAIVCSLFALVTLSTVFTVAHAKDDPQVPEIAYKVLDSGIACVNNAIEVLKERKPDGVPVMEEVLASLTKGRADLSYVIHGDPKRHLRGEEPAAMAKEYNGHSRANMLDVEMALILDIRNIGGDATKCEVAYNSIR